MVLDSQSVEAITRMLLSQAASAEIRFSEGEPCRRFQKKSGSYPGGSDTKAESRTGERTTDSGLRKRILVLIDEIQGLNTNL